jgi:hypothetical protein
MRAAPNARAIKAIFGLSLIALVFVAPRSLAEDLLSPIIGTVDGSSSQPSPTPTPDPTATSSPSASATPTPSPTQSNATASSAPIVRASDSATASASPPPPPKATTSQAMHIEVPATISVDPRAHSIFLPRIYASGFETLLICGHTSATALNMANAGAGVESVGNGSSSFRLSGPTNSVLAAFNGDMGARLISNSKAVSGSFLSLAFISLDKTSTDQALCNDGNASNTRTISFRAMNVDLNMVKDGVRLK